MKKIKEERYVNLDDILKILPKDDKVGPKPSYLRRYLKNLPYLPITIYEDIDAEGRKVEYCEFSH